VILLLPIIILWFKLGQLESSWYQSGLFMAMYLLLGLGYSLIRFPRCYSGVWACFSGAKAFGLFLLFSLIGVLMRHKEVDTLIREHKDA
jgi:hypothetical protein